MKKAERIEAAQAEERAQAATKAMTDALNRLADVYERIAIAQEVQAGLRSGTIGPILEAPKLDDLTRSLVAPETDVPAAETVEVAG